MASFLDPIRWPPDPVVTDDVIAFAGFPGIWREQVSLGYLRFYAFSSGASPVSSIGDQHLVTRIELEECVAAIRDGLVMGSIGGLSGGPVFVWRMKPILLAELIGFVTEYQEDWTYCTFVGLTASKLMVDFAIESLSWPMLNRFQNEIQLSASTLNARTRDALIV